MVSRVCCVSVTVVTGAIFLVAGIVFIPLSKTIVHNEVVSQLSIHNQATYDNWVKNPIPIFFQIFVWNLTNPIEVENGAKPAFQQSGPYTYSEWRKKINVTFHDNNGTVSYKEDRFFKFERQLSVGPEEAKFTTVNIPMMTVGTIVIKEFAFIQEAVEALLEWSHEELFISLSVRDIVWGYVDPLLNKTINLLKELHLKVNLDPKFGLFVNKNGSDDGLYNIYSGADGPSNFAMIHSWNGMTKLPYWTSNKCNMVNGTDGTMFPPFVSKEGRKYLFSSDLCRSIYLTFTKETTLRDIPLYRFVAPPEVFSNHTVNPDNAGFCAPTCYGSGVLDVGSCRNGAPVILSQPHFLSGDPKYIHDVDGMHPNQEEHQTVVDLEPTTGAAFNAAKKLQMNIHLQPINHLTQTTKLKDVIFPVLWLNESATLDKSLADKFKSELQTPILEMHVGIYVAIGIGGVLLLAVMIFLSVKRCNIRNSSASYSQLVDDN